MGVKTSDPSAWTSSLLLIPSLQRQTTARAGPDSSDCATHPRNQGSLPTPVPGPLDQLHFLAWQPWQYCVPTTEDAIHSVWTWEETEGRNQAVLPRYVVSDTNNCYMLYARCPHRSWHLITTGH